MKRPNSSNSHITIFPSSPLGEEKKIDEDDCTGEDDLCSSGHAAEKKRRLSSDQVRALEKSFEVENKLDPERKLRLAQELSLQPRQVAVWFQNRRARWKTKLLERDYTALTTSYDALRQDLDSLRRDNQALASEVKELKAKLGEEESYSSEETPPLTTAEAAAAEYNIKPSETLAAPATAPAMIYKDGSSDSDTSAVVNDEISPYHSMFPSSPAIISTNSPTFTISAPKAASQVWGSGATSARVAAASGFTFHHQVKTEEQGFNCFFSDEQPLYYYPDQWSWMDGGGDHGNFVSKEGLS